MATWQRVKVGSLPTEKSVSGFFAAERLWDGH
jgi:hypothetical protein